MLPALVYSPLGLGNFLLCVPLIERLSRERPVHVLIARPSAPLARRYQPALIDRIHVRREFLQTLRALRAQRFDRVYYAFPGARNWDYALIRLLRTRMRIGYAVRPAAHGMDLSLLLDRLLPYDDPSASEALLNLRMCDPAAGYDDLLARRDRYLIHPAVAEPAAEISVHMGSDVGVLGELKRWPIEHWRQLFGAVLDEFAIDRINVVIGPKEADIEQAVAGERGVRIVKSSLGDLIPVLARSRLVIGNDSGISHLGAFCGVPTIALFGPVSRAKSHPLFNLDNAIAEELACRPCQRIGEVAVCTNATQKLCMKLITPARVMDRIRVGGWLNDLLRS